MLPLGLYSVCLNANRLDRTVAFYRRLGFQPTGEDVPGLRVSLANGTDALTFMSFLKASLINFRGAHIHTLMEALQAAGVSVEGYNDHPDQPMMVDENGRTLPNNECGHFTVHDPDGHELFFNTHPHERAPFEAALKRGVLTGGIRSETADEQSVLGRFVYCVEVTDVGVSGSFYETLGLVVTPMRGGAWVAPPARHRGAHFVLQLRRRNRAGLALRFHYEREASAAPKALGFVKDGGGWAGLDPDGRRLELVPSTDLPPV